MAGRQKVLGHHNIRMIPVKDDMSHLFLVNKALDDSEIVSMPADRIIGSAKTVTARFLGADARFPAGPFSVAAMKGLDVLVVNVMKTSARGYSYVKELERRVRQYPLQWFNFHDFWS